MSILTHSHWPHHFLSNIIKIVKREARIWKQIDSRSPLFSCCLVLLLCLFYHHYSFFLKVRQEILRSVATSLFSGASHVVQCQCRRGRFDLWTRKIPWSRKWQPTPVFLPGVFHRQRSLEGCSPWGRKELDTIEHACTLCSMMGLLLLHTEHKRQDFVGYLRQNEGIDWGIGTAIRLMVYLEQGVWNREFETGPGRGFIQNLG